MWVAILLLRPALGWSLRPLLRLRRAVEARDGDARPDFSALDAGPLPSELRPLARAFNRLLRQLDQATGGVRRFTADASHKMRTPISVLKVQIELARRGSREAFDEIADAAQRLERLVTQLLALARAEEAGASPPLETVDLKEVSAVVVNRLINQAIQAQVELNLEASDAESYRVEAHRTLVFEILANLVDNGIRYNRPGGTVTIALAQGEDATLMTVSDDGPGIAVEHRDKVFERFFRVGGASAPEGTGLGLAIVQSAASRMGAQVEIVEGGAGTHIRVRFPRRGEDGGV